MAESTLSDFKHKLKLSIDLWSESDKKGEKNSPYIYIFYFKTENLVICIWQKFSDEVTYTYEWMCVKYMFSSPQIMSEVDLWPSTGI